MIRQPLIFNFQLSIFNFQLMLRLNIISAVLTCIGILYFLLFEIREVSIGNLYLGLDGAYILLFPLLFIISLLLSIRSVYLKKNTLGIILISINMIGFIVTLLFYSYVSLLAKHWH